MCTTPLYTTVPMTSKKNPISCKYEYLFQDSPFLPLETGRKGGKEGKTEIRREGRRRGEKEGRNREERGRVQEERNIEEK